MEANLGIKAISFDFWNTLFTEQPGGFRFYYERRRELLAEALTQYGDFTLEQIELAFLLEAKSHYRIWTEEHRTPSAAERLDRLLGLLGVRMEDGKRRELVAAFEEGILELPPAPVEGALEVMERLAGRCRLGIISDIGFSPGRVLRQVLKRAGLIEFFDSLIFSDEVGRSKPHVEVFRRSATELGAEPPHILHVGDLEHTDIVGAKRAGWRAIRFVGITPIKEEETTLADKVTSRLTEIPELLTEL